MYKMVVITIENCTNAKVHTIKVRNRKLFWIRMIDIQNGLGLKTMSDLVRKEIHGIFNTNNPTKSQVKNHKRSLQEITKDSVDDSKIKYAHSDPMEKIIKNCRGVKECKNGINRKKKKNKENFRILLDIKENDIFLAKEHSVLKSIMDVFEGENMQTE